MACPNMIPIFRPGISNYPTPPLWDKSTGRFGGVLYVPCGQCYWCRFVRVQMWALRCYLEASTHKDNSFITLTYAPKNLPKNSTLVKDDLQRFIKRLRKYLVSHYNDKKIRFYAGAEYGSDEHTAHPHYHILLFGHQFEDRYYHGKSNKGHPIFRSPTLEKCWKLGFSSCGDLNFTSAAYAARYIKKKINGDMAEGHYEGRLPEFQLQSTTPGIGAAWYHANKSTLWETGRIFVEGKEKSFRAPRYFERILKKEDPERWADYQQLKRKYILENHGADPDQEPDDD